MKISKLLRFLLGGWFRLNVVPGGTGGDDGQQQQQTNQQLSARQQAMAEIASRAHAEVAPDLDDFDEDTGQITRREQTADKQQSGQQTQQQGQSQNDGPGESQQQQQAQGQGTGDDDQVTLIVDGKEVKVTRDKIIEAGTRTLQKESAADRRLQEATELFRQAQLYAQSHGLNNGLPKPGVRQQQGQHQQNTDPSGEDDQAQQQGQSQQHQQQPAFDVREFQRTIDQQLEDKLYMRDAQKAATQFKTDFPEVANNPVLMTWVVQQENIRLQEATAKGEAYGDPFEAYRKHGDEAKKHLAALKPAGATPEDKKERKRDTVVVTGASLRAPAPQQADKPKTRDQVLSEMRKARGQRIN